MICDISYFVGDILIPNLGGSGFVVAGNEAEVTRFVAIHEPELLTCILGPAFYNEFKAGLTTDTIPEKWVKLRDLLADNTSKISVIADYVYYFIIRNRITSTTGIGEVHNQAENGEVIPNWDKAIRAYNRAASRCEFVKSALSAAPGDYPGFDESKTSKIETTNYFGL